MKEKHLLSEEDNDWIQPKGKPKKPKQEEKRREQKQTPKPATISRQKSLPFQLQAPSSPLNPRRLTGSKSEGPSLTESFVFDAMVPGSSSTSASSSLPSSPSLSAHNSFKNGKKATYDADEFDFLELEEEAKTASNTSLDQEGGEGLLWTIAGGSNSIWSSSYLGNITFACVHIF
jgi:hypothetical protein